MRFWWVNHKQTYDHEVGKGYIWCPKLQKGDRRNHFYETLREVQTGDLVFSYADSHLRAVGVAQFGCYSCPRPDEFGKVGLAWDVRGWRVDVKFQKFNQPLRVSAVAGEIARLLPPKYSPVQANGHGNQGAYLAEISAALARRLLELAEAPLVKLMSAMVLKDRSEESTGDPLVLIDWEDRLQATIESSLIPETTRQALIYARKGQGKFKENVAKLERECRITHVGNPTHLIASHIKPWREASDDERLEGANGLLLTPSVDHLFDRGFISFGDEGEVLVSPVADHESLGRMGVVTDRPLLVGKFTADQRHFLDYHRKGIFLKSAV
jgi:putative restriction endonuclease